MLALAAGYIFPLARAPFSAAFPANSPYTDLLISHLSNAAYLRDSLGEFGQWPLWNAQLFGGQPFAADPLAGMWYPPNWLLLVVPLMLGFNLLFWLHLAAGGLGVYLLLRAEGVGGWPALLAGACFAGTPKLIAHIGAGHVSLVAAVAWTPWLLLAVRRAARAAGWQNGATAGVVLALTFLADVRWAFYAGWLAVGYAAFAVWGNRSNYNKAARPQTAKTVAAAGKSDYSATKAMFGAAVTALLLAAPLALPLVEFVQHSRRAGLSLAEAGEFSLPPIYLLGLLIPNVGGFHEYMTYVGVIPLVLAAAGVGRHTAFWWATALVAAVVALGVNGPLYPVLFRMLPGLNLMRVPPRAWFLVALALCALAGHGAQRLRVEWLPELARRYGREVGPMAATRVVVALFVLAVLDLARIDGTLIEARPRPEVNEAAAWLGAQPGQFRVYSPSYSLPPGDGLEHLEGVDPLQLASAGDEIEAATGIAAEGYSVTVPPFATDDLAHEHSGARPDPARLGRLNVRYVAVEFDLDVPGLRLTQQFGQTRIYFNEADLGRAWMEAGGGGVEIGGWSPNRIELKATGPGRLVLSEIVYPGWRVWVDGLPAEIETQAGVLRAASLGAGEHTVVFEFRPMTVYVGLGLGLAGLGLWGTGWVYGLRKNRA
jgi:hypothetical protein